jgi:23S rRNA pseudouridine1911/1915/1917 synthase
MYFYHPKWPIFHLDNHLLVLYKPAGLIMQRDIKDTVNLLDLAKGWIKERFAKPGRVFAGMVHRLDAPVAGVIVLARTSKAASRLSAQFRDGTVRKTYLAVVCGRPAQPGGRLVDAMERAGRLSRIVPASTPGSQEARLTYKVTAEGADRSVLEIQLETGRRHQIRVQLSALGCPIVGDLAYGAPHGMAHGRIALMARRLSFDHPTLGDQMEFVAPIPAGWPWPGLSAAAEAPLWALEDFQSAGLKLSR